MKRIKLVFVLLLCIVMVFCLPSCGDTKNIFTGDDTVAPTAGETTNETVITPAGKEPYSGEEWIKKSTPNTDNETTFKDIRIDAIYSDCFFAQYIIPLPTQIKINGVLSDDWCVGDHVTCACSNVYYDQDTERYEGDLVSIEKSDFTLQPDVAYKPVIYLYPTEETEVKVKLDLDGELLCAYPSYRDGWRVKASPDGTLSDGRLTYSYLFWEGRLNTKYDFSEGFCIKGSDTAAFLETALAQLGLNRREANEFIVFWLEKMQEHPYNVISFQTEAYTDHAGLEITPQPDTVIRVFMAWRPSDEFVELPEQTLSAPERSGFTAVEWGGVLY